MPGTPAEDPPVYISRYIQKILDTVVPKRYALTADLPVSGAAPLATDGTLAYDAQAKALKVMVDGVWKTVTVAP